MEEEQQGDEEGMGNSKVVGMCINSNYHNMLSLLPLTIVATSNTIPTIDDTFADTMGHNPFDSPGTIAESLIIFTH